MIALWPLAVAADQSLRVSLARAAARARQLGAPVTVSQTVAIPAPDDPLALFEAARSSHRHAVYWEQPTAAITLVGIGAARVIHASGSQRFQRAKARLRQESATELVENLSGISDSLVGPVFLGGFPFDPERTRAMASAGSFPNGLLVLPQFLVALRGETATLTINARVDPGTDPAMAGDELARALALVLEVNTSHPQRRDPVRVLTEKALPLPDIWKASVADAAADIRAGLFDKIVLAREILVEASESFDPVDALRRLRETYPSAYIFAVTMHDHCFLGATPELLVRLMDGEVEVSCLAGSTARGVDQDEDDRLGHDLLSSAKDRVEHEVVARDIEEALAGVCLEVHRLSSTPALMRLLNVQHLYTAFCGRVAEGQSVLDLVESLHPTSAVGGYPRNIALATIREREGIDRGWYAGPIGWVNQSGDGEFAVAIRSALLVGSRASLYAGVGVVADSDPEAEYVETCLKFRPMLSALGGRP